MSLKEGLISELKKGQFSPILFDDVSSHLWDEKIKSKEYYFFILIYHNMNKNIIN